MSKKIVRSSRLVALCAIALAASSFSSGAADNGGPKKPPTPIHVDSLNSGEHVLVGRLGHPFGTYHVVRATFGMPVPKGRAGNGGRLYLRVVEVDGEKLAEPQWIPYFKSVTLQEYVLPDGTNIFPEHPRTHTLNGKTIVCKVYEDLGLLDLGRGVHFGDTTKRGFEVLHYETALGILHVVGVEEAK